MSGQQANLVLLVEQIVTLVAGIWLVWEAWRLRIKTLQLRADQAELKAMRRKLENPELPGCVMECLDMIAKQIAPMSAGRRLAGQHLADKLRTTLAIPDATLAAALHDVLWMADRLLDQPPEDRFSFLVQIMSAAAVDLSALDRETSAS